MTNTDNSQIPARNGTAAGTNTSMTGTTPISHRVNFDCFIVRNKLDFIHGTIKKPPEGSPLLRQWQRCNDLVVAWAANSVTKEIHRSVVYSEFAKDIWRELEARYGKADGARVFELKKALAHISQGSLDIASYFTKIKQLWDELASISVHSENRCNCIGGAKSEEEQKVYQFLMGLNGFMSVRPPSMPLLTLVDLSLLPKYNRSSEASLYCKCKRDRRIIEKCHRLHGYPSNFKFTKGSGPNSGPRKVAAKAACESYPTDSSTSFVPFNESTQMTVPDQTYEGSGLTKDEHSQLQFLLHKTHISPGSSHSLMASAHFAGPFSEEATGSW
ncbi:uncharacterized protein LOC132042266 [Lycium ferocissimum]|uniref:uncharacterized protein LOC132042266 n=1 Tax=Lycium ferocissimum TaxID=112874 RepID=UPI0028153872|nr:uncharacterized protein LOC132042266 [Lycium ferocissimum]